MRDENGVWWVRVFCISCGRRQGLVTEENMRNCSFICDHPCAEKYGRIEGAWAVSDAEFFRNVEQEQIERYGRVLTAPEMANVLSDVNNPFAALVRDFQSLQPYRGS